MHIAVDLDGTIDSSPEVFQSLMATMKAAGHTVTVLTGAVIPSGATTAVVAAAKAQYLAKLGLAHSYSQLVVIPQNPKGSGKGKESDGKAEWLQQNHVDLFIDNNKGNAKAAIKAGVKLVLVPWATRA